MSDSNKFFFVFLCLKTLFSLHFWKIPETVFAVDNYLLSAFERCCVTSGLYVFRWEIHFWIGVPLSVICHGSLAAFEIFFVFIFQKFNYEVSYYLFLAFLFMVHLASWVCSSVSFAKLELFSHCFLKCSFSLLISYPSEALIIQTLEYFIIPQVHRALFSFSLFSLCCSKCVTCIVCPQVYVLCHLQSTIKPIQQVTYFSYCNFQFCNFPLVLSYDFTFCWDFLFFHLFRENL